MDEATAATVRVRAGGRCEYCRLPADRVLLRFEIEHIVPRKHGGPDAAANLALACPHCNRHKGTDLAGLDRASGRARLTRLFNPRRQVWDDHFTRDGAHIVGKTPTGRVTVGVLNMNAEVMVNFRAALIAEGVYPPPG